MFNYVFVPKTVHVQAGTPLTPWLGFDRANIQGGTAPAEMQRPDVNPAFACSIELNLG